VQRTKAEKTPKKALFNTNYNL